jgi:hypothetical protein
VFGFLSQKEFFMKLNRSVMLAAIGVLAMEFTLVSFAFADNDIRFGARANLGMAQITPNEILLTNGGTVTVEGGGNLGLGGFALIPIWGIYFVPEIAMQRRVTIKSFPVNNFSKLTVTETAIDVPLLFRFRYREENLIYLGIGPYLGVVLDLQDDGDGTFKNYRPRSDVGIASELGFRINEHFSIDLRGLGSFSDYGFGEYLGIGGETPTLFQFQVGLNYTF